MSALTLLSRLLGFVRDLVFARFFGASRIADAFFVAFRIPNLLRSFVAEGALTSAFVPVFSDELAESREAAKQALSQVAGFLLALTSLLSILGILLAPEIVSLFGFGAEPQQAELCTRLLMVMMPFIIFVSFVAMLNGALNSLKIFGAAPLAQIVMNIVLIVGALIAGFFDTHTGALVLASFVLIGGVCQILVQFPALIRSELLVLPSRHFFGTVTRQVTKLMVPAVIGAAAYQILMFINTLLATMLKSGSVSWLFYADRIAQIPIGVFSVALSSVLLPLLSVASSRQNESEYRESLSNALRFTSFFILPVSAGLYIYAHDLIQLFFERGAFDAQSTTQTARAVQALTLGLWPMSIGSLFTKAFIARKDTVTPTVIGFCSLIVGTFLALTFMGKPTTSDQDLVAQLVITAQGLCAALPFSLELAHVGLALASSCTFFSLRWILGSPAASKVIITHLETLLKILFFFTRCLRWHGSGLAQFRRLVSNPLRRLSLGIPVGVVSFIAFSALLRSQELKETSRQFSD